MPLHILRARWEKAGRRGCEVEKCANFRSEGVEKKISLAALEWSNNLLPSKQNRVQELEIKCWVGGVALGLDQKDLLRKKVSVQRGWSFGYPWYVKGLNFKAWKTEIAGRRARKR